MWIVFVVLMIIAAFAGFMVGFAAGQEYRDE